ncbi:MAG: peptidase M16 [Planctomycetaceae bacterium]|nr:peptidase M16 [Planctomycetaceae bacterium]
MQDQTIRTHSLPNGLTLVLEPMVDVQSAAFSLLIPAGSIYDPPQRGGTGSILSDLITRGAGQFDSKQLSLTLDNLGLQRSESVGVNHMALTGAALAENIPQALQTYADIVQRPKLPPDQFDAARAGVEQSLLSIEDDPRQKSIIELRRRCYAAPWGRPSEGSLDELTEITIDDVSGHFRRCFHPNGAILGVAGNIDVEQIRDVVEESFAAWQPGDTPTFETVPAGPKRDHIPHDSSQTHIGIAYNAVPYRDPDYYAAWAAVGVLSGGMSSRLFTEVREKRGLCYSIYASLNSLYDEARVLCYAGTTAERAQETLDVTLRELVRLGEGIDESELERCRARAKSSLVMQQESTFARSSSIARDWFFLNRVTTLDEVGAKIDALTIEAILDYVSRFPANDFTLLTIGPEQLEVPDEFS